MSADSPLSRPVYAGDAYKPFGDFTLADVQAKAAELTAATGWGPTARVGAVARGWSELARAMTAAGAEHVSELPLDACRGVCPQAVGRAAGRQPAVAAAQASDTSRGDRVAAVGSRPSATPAATGPSIATGSPPGASPAAATGRSSSETRAGCEGLSMQSPWARSQPSRVSSSIVSVLSTPSATTRSRRAWPSAIVARTSSTSRD